MIFIQAGVVRCETVGPFKAKEDVKISLKAYSKFLEQNLMEQLYDSFLAKNTALKP